MSDANIKSFTPVFIKRINEKVSLQEVRVKAKISKKRDLRLLEWALLAPISKINPKPGITQISEKFGISKQEFLEVVAKKLVVLGMINQVDSDHYELTPRGEKLFREGKIISDPEDIFMSILYEPTMKEWLVGFQLPVAKEEELSDSIDASDLVIPDPIAHQHARETKAIRKGDELSNTSIEDVRERTIDIQTRILLVNSGIEFMVDGISGEARSIIAKSIKNKLSIDGNLEDHLKDLYEIERKYGASERISPHQLIDCKIVPITEIENQISKVIQDKPKWAIVNVDQIFNKIMATGTRVIVIGSNNYPNISNVNKSLQQVILQDAHIINGYLIITDKWLLKIARVICDECEIPVLIVSENTGQVRYFDKLIEICKAKSRDDEVTARVAQYYLDISQKNFTSIIEALSKKQIKDMPTIKDILKTKELLGDNSLINEEKLLYKSLIDNYSLEQLIKNDNDICSLLPTICEARVAALIKKDLDKSTIKEIIRNYEGISTKLKKCKPDTKHIFDRAISDVLADVTVDLSQFGNDKSAENISNSLKLMDLLIAPEDKARVGDYIVKLIQDNDSPAETIRSWYMKLKEKGYVIQLPEVERLCKKMVKELDFKWFNPVTTNKIDNINKMCKKLSPKFTSLQVLLPLPEVSGCVSDKNEIRGLIDNLTGLSKIYSNLDDAFIQRALSVQEEFLRSNDADKSMDLWLSFIDDVRRYEKSKGMNYIDVSNDTIVDLVSARGEAFITRNKKTLDSLGLFNKAKASIKSAPTINNTPSVSVAAPPLKRIVVDGSNVAWQGQDGKVPLAAQIIIAYTNLKRLGFDTILIILDASMRHRLGIEEFEKLQEFFNNEKRNEGPDILLVAPAETRADEFIIKNAIDNDMLILSNDLYRDFRSKSSQYEAEIKKRLVKYMFNPLNSNELQLSDYPGS